MREERATTALATRDDSSSNSNVMVHVAAPILLSRIVFLFLVLRAEMPCGLKRKKLQPYVYKVLTCIHQGGYFLRFQLRNGYKS